MTQITWPDDLPDDFLIRGYGSAMLDNTIRTTMDSGIIKTRMKSSVKRTRISGTMLMTPTQLKQFEDFYTNRLKHGALRFRWKNPVDGTPADFLFIQPPTVRTASNMFEVSMELMMEEA